MWEFLNDFANVIRVVAYLFIVHWCYWRSKTFVTLSWLRRLTASFFVFLMLVTAASPYSRFWASLFADLNTFNAVAIAFLMIRDEMGHKRSSRGEK